MTTYFSLYLDLIRFLAALAVFVSHVSSDPFTKDVIWWRLSAYGDTAVTLFFVLSGYVIAHVTSTRERRAKDYFAARAARLYSVTGVGLMLTLLCDGAGIFLHPAYYEIEKVLWKPESWTGYLASAVFLNEFQVFGFDGIAPGTNAPYWSLSFEAAYYVVAGLMLFSRRAVWIPCVLLLLALAGKTITALLPIWALGFFLYRTRPGLMLPAPLSLGLAVLSALAVLGAPEITSHWPHDNFGASFPWGIKPFNRNLIADYFVATAFAIHLVSVRMLLARPGSVSGPTLSRIRWLGSLTFPLYCFHFPAICFLGAMSPWSNTSAAHLAFLSAGTFAVVIALTPFCERLKVLLRHGLAGPKQRDAERPSPSP